MIRVELNHDWQGGPSFVEVEGDVIGSDGHGGDVGGVILRFETEAEIGAGDTFRMELGAGAAELELRGPGGATLAFSVAGSDQQIRALIAALEAELEP